MKSSPSSGSITLLSAASTSSTLAMPASVAIRQLRPDDRSDYGAGIVTFSDKPAVLVVAGDEDRSTQSRRRRALSRALQVKTDVLVDLSDLVFADASLIVDL